VRFTLSLIVFATIYIAILSWSATRPTPVAQKKIHLARAPFTPVPLLPPEPAAPATLAEETPVPVRARPTEAPDPQEAEASVPPSRDDEDEPSEPASEPASDTLPPAAPADRWAGDVPAAPVEEPVNDDVAAPVDATPPVGGDASDDREPDTDDREPAPDAYADLPEDLQQLPDLVIDTGENTDWDQIDAMLGIQTLAYTVDTAEPTTYLTWAPGGQAVQADTVDLKPFSNRCRDRNNIAHYRRRLTRAKRDLGISRPMRVVGLVPNNVDRRFAAAQLAAIKASGFEPANVRSTLARYHVDENGNYGIVVYEIKPFADQRGGRGG
jgi:hypothetical protein